MRRLLLVAATALTVAAPLFAAIPVAADSPPASRVSEVILDDAEDDVWLYSDDTSSYELWGTKADADVMAATVQHGEKVIRVVMSFDNLRKKRPATYLARIKTRKMVKTAWVGASKEGGGWDGRHGLQRGLDKVPSPGFTHAIDYQADTVVMTLPRELFKEPAWIQVKLTNNLTGARLFTDNPHNSAEKGTLTEKIYTP